MKTIKVFAHGYECGCPQWHEFGCFVAAAAVMRLMGGIKRSKYIIYISRRPSPPTFSIRRRSTGRGARSPHRAFSTGVRSTGDAVLFILTYAKY